MLCIKIDKGKANSAISRLCKDGLMDRGRKIENDGIFVYIPVIKKINGFGYCSRKLKVREVEPKNLEEALGRLGIMSRNVLSSFDLLGTIVIVEIPSGIDPKKVAKAIMMVHKNVETVFQKASGMKGKYRVRELKLIGGKNQKIARYIENGAKLELDVGKVFFSPRLSNERKRISGLVKKKENVLVLFAGVGPFAMCIAKQNPKSKVIGIELNRDAVKWFDRNIKLNRLDNVEAVLGDVRKEMKKKRYSHWANRIIMPLPKDAEFFLADAERACRKGTIIHFYTFVDSKNYRKETIKKIENNLNRKFRIKRLKQVRGYSPRIVQIVADIEVL